MKNIVQRFMAFWFFDPVRAACADQLAHVQQECIDARHEAGMARTAANDAFTLSEGARDAADHVKQIIQAFGNIQHLEQDQTNRTFVAWDQDGNMYAATTALGILEAVNSGQVHTTAGVIHGNEARPGSAMHS